MRYMLDTNMISHLLKCPNGSVAERVARLKSGELGTSIIVAAELRFGYVRKSSNRLEKLVNTVLGDFEVAAWDHPADQRYAELRAHLESNGTLIGSNHMLIAAHALALEATLVTDNEKEFSRVPGLKSENWLR
jgi:tRNA(fMet)-specific endonuclease VapC